MLIFSSNTVVGEGEVHSVIFADLILDGDILCSFHDLSELKKCSQLERLMIYNCTTPFDAAWTEGMGKLEYLDFNGAEILNYEYLKKLDTLHDMSLYFCTLSQDEIDEIQSALPSCTIDVEF